MNGLKRIVLGSQDSAFVALLLLVGGLAGAKDILNLVLPGDFGLYLILLFFAFIFAKAILQDRRNSKISPLPTAPKIFNPFRRLLGNDIDIWPRDAEAVRIVEQIDASAHSHLIISGPSGAGKSTLVQRIVIPLIDQRYRTRVFSEYAGIVVSVIDGFADTEKLQISERSLISRTRALLLSSHCDVKDVFEPGFIDNNPDVTSLWADLEAHFLAVLSDATPRCFVFDQIERYLHGVIADIENPASTTNGYELFLFMNFVKFCREQTQCRTAFVIRSDQLYESVDFLEAIVSARIQIGQVNYVLCPGINTATSFAGVMRIRESFRSLGLGNEQTQRFDRVCGLESRTYSNTFMTQMVGYVVENFFKSDKDVSDLLRYERDRANALRIYFRHFLNDYISAASSDEALEAMKAVLFAIATENLATGRAVTLDRVSGLCHMPRDVVADAILFAAGKGVLVEEADGNEPSYRFIHDLMSDYVRENEQFSIDSTLKDAIRGLCEKHVSMSSLTPVGRYADVLRDLWEDLNFPLASLWVFFIFGALRTKIPDTCSALLSGFSQIPFSAQCDILAKVYFPIYILHVVWLMFIYHMHRDYFRYIYANSKLRFASAAMPVIGAALALLLSQSPTLFIIPVTAVGALMGMLLLAGVVTARFVGRERLERRKWGVRTVVNMTIATTLSVFTGLVFWPDPIATKFWGRVGESLSVLGGVDVGWPTISAVWMYVVCGVMIYFWLHIRPEQQSRMACAARLAAFDRGRSEHDG